MKMHLPLALAVGAALPLSALAQDASVAPRRGSEKAGAAEVRIVQALLTRYLDAVKGKQWGETTTRCPSAPWLRPSLPPTWSGSFAANGTSSTRSAGRRSATRRSSSAAATTSTSTDKSTNPHLQILQPLTR